MGFQIEDGKGSGISAQVDSLHRLRTLSDFRDIEMFATDEELGYLLYGSCNLAVTAAKYGLLYLKNTSSDHIYITRIYLRTENIGVNGVYVLFLKNPTVSTTAGEEGIAITAINKNYSSGKSVSVDAFIADTTNLEFSNYGTTLHKMWLNEKTNYEIDLRGSNELIQNNIFGIRWMATQAGNPTDGTKINVSLNYVALSSNVS